VEFLMCGNFGCNKIIILASRGNTVLVTYIISHLAVV